MIEIFKERAKQVETTVLMSSYDSLEITRLLNSFITDECNVIISKFRFLNEMIISDFTNTSQKIIHNPNNLDMEAADYSITDSFAGIAETGSVCIVNDSDMSGTYSLFAKNHIVFLESRVIVPRPRDLYITEPFRSIVTNENITIVSGSSATADMGPLVRGVHGPAKLIVIILS